MNTERSVDFPFQISALQLDRAADAHDFEGVIDRLSLEEPLTASQTRGRRPNNYSVPKAPRSASA